MVGTLKKLLADRKRLSPEAFRKAKPVRHASAEWRETEDGSVLIQIPLELEKPWMRFIAERSKWPTSKQFELEPIGGFVWTQCDGQTTNETIARRLREKYKMNRLEAEASLSAFLETLSQRKLVSLIMGTKK